VAHQKAGKKVRMGFEGGIRAGAWAEDKQEEGTQMVVILDRAQGTASSPRTRTVVLTHDN